MGSSGICAIYSVVILIPPTICSAAIFMLFLFDFLTKCSAILSDQPTDKMSIYLFNEFLKKKSLSKNLVKICVESKTEINIHH